EGKVVVEWVDDPFVSSMRLVEDFGFRQARGKLWTASRGQLIEGKGLPPLLRDQMGQPFEGGFRKSALLYDSAVQKMTEPWEQAQRMFFEASVVEGVPAVDAKVMYLILAVQGTRWEVSGSRCYGSCHGRETPLEWRPVVSEARVGELMTWVRANDPGLREIDLRAQSAIRAVGPHIFPQSKCNEFSGSTRIRRSCD
ncbi:MAG: DUF1353 domain-containing protein, partial [Betaproteobacteria bacterium]